MPIQIAICDDFSTDSQRLISILKTKDSFCECRTYASGEELLWDFENGRHFDILFIDIFMNGMNGIDVAKRIRDTDSDVILIFVSSSNDFYRESYDLYAFHYLLKPVSEDKLIEVYCRALDRIQKNAEQSMRISFQNDVYTIRYSQLLYATSNQHLIHFFLKNGELLKSYGKLDDIASQLPTESFIRCHKSYIVNLNHVTNMTATEFYLGEIHIPISRNFSRQAREKYHEMMFNEF